MTLASLRWTWSNNDIDDNVVIVEVSAQMVQLVKYFDRAARYTHGATL